MRTSRRALFFPTFPPPFSAFSSVSREGVPSSLRRECSDECLVNCDYGIWGAIIDEDRGKRGVKIARRIFVDFSFLFSSLFR